MQQMYNKHMPRLSLLLETRSWHSTQKQVLSISLSSLLRQSHRVATFGFCGSRPPSAEVGRRSESPSNYDAYWEFPSGTDSFRRLKLLHPGRGVTKLALESIGARVANLIGAAASSADCPRRPLSIGLLHSSDAEAHLHPRSCPVSGNIPCRSSRLCQPSCRHSHAKP